MTRYQLVDESGEVYDEGSFATFDEATVWAQQHPRATEAWEMQEHADGGWRAALRSPNAAQS